MGKVYVRQNGQLTTVDEATLQDSTLGRGSAALKKRVVKVGEQDGRPIYELQDMAPPPANPTRFAPLPTRQDPQEAAPKPQAAPRPVRPGFNPLPERLRGETPLSPLPPYRSPTPLPKATLGITGEPSQTGGGTQSPIPASARGRVQSKAQRAKQRSGVKALAPAKKPAPAKKDDSWVAKFQADAIPPEPPLSQETPKPGAAFDGLAQVLEKYKTPEAADGGWTPEAAKAWADEQPKPPVADPLAKYKQQPELDVPPLDAATDVPPVEAPSQDPLSADAQKARQGDAWEWTEGQTEQVSQSEVDPMLKGRYLDSLDAQEEETGARYQDLVRQMDEQKGRDAEAQAKLNADRQALLENYTAGLDGVGKARFMDTLINNIGKIVAGGVGLQQGVDVAKHYKYQGPDLEAERKDVQDVYGANLKNLEDQEKARRESRDEDFARRKTLLDMAIKVPEALQNKLATLMEMEKRVVNSGNNANYKFLGPSQLQWMIQEQDWKTLEAELNRQLERARIAASIRNTDVRSSADVRAAGAKQTATEGTKEGKQTEVTINPETRLRFHNQLTAAEIPSDLSGTEAWVKADGKTKATLLGRRLEVLARNMESMKRDDKAKAVREASSLIRQMAPYITAPEELDDLRGTFDKLTAPNGPLRYLLTGEKQTGSQEETRSNQTTVSGRPAPASTPAATPAATPAPAGKTVKMGGQTYTVEQARKIVTEAIAKEKDPKRKAALEAKLQQLK